MPNPSTPLLERDIRQRDIVPPEPLASCRALVIGVGAIGRQVALQLAAIGMPRLILVDHDDVRIENLAPQGYLVEDLQAFKVDATAALCRRINPEIEVTTLAERFKRSSARDLGSDQRLLVFACVDRIVTRQLVWEAVRLRAALFIDGRISAEVIRILTVAAPATDRQEGITSVRVEQVKVERTQLENNCGSITERSAFAWATRISSS